MLATDSDATTLLFRTEIESYVYRVKYMLNLLVNKNSALINNEYNTAKIATRVNWLERFHCLDTFDVGVDALKASTEQISNDLVSGSDGIDLLSHEQLKNLDEKFSQTLSTMGVTYNLPGIDEITQPVMEVRATTYAEYFENNLKAVALELLENSKTALSSYELSFRDIYQSNEELKDNTHGYGSTTKWQDVKLLIARDQEIIAELNEIEQTMDYINSYFTIPPSPEIMKQTLDGTGDLARTELSKSIGVYVPFKQIYANYEQYGNTGSFYSDTRDVLAECINGYQLDVMNLIIEQQLLREELPLLEILEEAQVDFEENSDSAIFEHVNKSIAKAYEAQNELTEKIISGSVNLCKLDLLVTKTLEKLEIVEFNDPFSIEIQKYIEEKQKEGFALTLLGIGLAVGAYACFFIPGAQPLSIVLGVAGAAVSGAEGIAAYNQAMNHQDALVGATGDNNMTSKTLEEVNNDILWAKIELALAGLDVVMVGIDVVEIGKPILKVSRVFSRSRKTKKLLKVLNHSQIDVLSKLEPEYLAKFVGKIDSIDSSKLDGIINIFDNIDHIPNAFIDDIVSKNIDDLQIPKDSSVLDLDGNIDWRQAPEGGYVLDDFNKAIKNPVDVRAGDIVDRYGPNNGRYVSPVIDGKVVSYNERSLPYIEDPSHYHQYEFTSEMNSIESAINKCTDKDLKKAIWAYIDRWELDIKKLEINFGEIAEAFGENQGGGIQYELPLPIVYLEKLGVLKEIK